MQLHKLVKDTYIFAVKYHTETKRMRIKPVAGASIQFTPVPLDVFLNFPVGPKSHEYFLSKVKGRFLREEISDEQYDENK